MTEAMLALRDVAIKHPELCVLLPMHRNPVVRDVVETNLLDQPNVLLTESLSYHEFAHVLRACRLVVTDSGGVQEEAPSLGKPVLVMRDTTERPEAVKAGTVMLVGADKQRIVDGVATLLTDAHVYSAMSRAINPYGDGKACERIVKTLTEQT